MLLRLLPVLLLSGCAVADAIGAGVSAVGDGTKYVVDKVNNRQADPDPTAPPAAPSARASRPAAMGPNDGPAIAPAPMGEIEVQPLD